MVCVTENISSEKRKLEFYFVSLERESIKRFTIFSVVVCGCVGLYVTWLYDDFASIVTGPLDLHDLRWLTVLLNHLHRTVARLDELTYLSGLQLCGR